jgi:hypothetical protein
MEDQLHRVTFRFGGNTEVQYLAQLPEAGDHVSHGHELWVVSRVDTDALGTLVVCEPPPRNPGGSRSRGGVESAV